MLSSVGTKEGLSLAEIHGVKRKAVRKCTARKTTKISPKQVQAAAKEHPEESPKFLLALKDQDTPISEREYSEMSCTLGSLIAL